ncbi:MAG: tetratricopeptide repeat protein [Thermodesulfobacteriota bacterium]
MAEKKISRKELLKEPDEFLTWSAKTVQYVEQNPRKAYTAVAVVVAIFALAMAYYSYGQYQIRAGHEALEKVYAQYRQASESTEDVAPDTWDKILADFDAVIQKYGSSPASEVALLYSGHVLYKKDDLKGALQRYEKMQSTSLAEKGLGSLVIYHIAMTRMAMAEYEQAVQLFDSLAKNTGSPYRREAYASIAKIYLTTGKNKEALQAYKQYLKMFPQAPDAAFVRVRIAGLAGEES